MDILEISHVSKSFGSNKVIDDLSFSVPEHSVFGFIGKNGAGKTTTMKMVLGLLKADEGEISAGCAGVLWLYDADGILDDVRRDNRDARKAGERKVSGAASIGGACRGQKAYPWFFPRNETADGNCAGIVKQPQAAYLR